MNQVIEMNIKQLLVFVDAGVEGYQDLIKGVMPGVEAFVLHPEADGIHQIIHTINSLKSSSHIDSIDLAIHIISHGTPGTLYLGNSELSLSTLDRYAQHLKTAFSTTSELHLYGCNVAAGDAGSEFLDKLSHLTGASLAASTHQIGNGNWNCNVKIGNTTTTLPFTLSVLQTYHGLLSFSSPILVPIGDTEGAYALVAGDFNNDGNDDFAAAYAVSKVAIRLGDGAGNFSGNTDVSVNSYVAPDIAIADFNNDGNIDFATANANANTVSIRLGDGLGGFSGNTNIAAGQGVYSIAIADFNNDGNADFVTANSDDTASVSLGDGAGGFSSTTAIAIGDFGLSVAIGDFNNGCNRLPAQGVEFFQERVPIKSID